MSISQKAGFLRLFAFFIAETVTKQLIKSENSVQYASL